MSDLPSGFDTNTGAADISFDGGVIAGTMFNSQTGRSVVWRWTSATGIQEVPGLTNVSAISPDGSTIVGGVFGEPRPAKWRATTGVVLRPDVDISPNPGDPARAGFASAASFDGSVVVGGAVTTVFNPFQRDQRMPFRWVGDTATAVLQPDGSYYYFGAANGDGTGATDVSWDGSVLVGSGSRGLWRWTQATGLQELGFATSGLTSGVGPKISGDASTVIFADAYWNAVDGTTRRLPQVLSAAGCDFTGWSNLVATDVSFDGRALCGYGVNPQGLTEAWYATVPGPGTMMLFAGGGVIVRRRRR